jgi:hypothetical protein
VALEIIVQLVSHQMRQPYHHEGKGTEVYLSREISGFRGG